MIERENELKQYGWFVSKVYSLLVRIFFKDTYVVEQFKSRIDPSEKVLELGSGPGNDYDFLKDHYNITGSDYSDVFLKDLQKKYREGKFIKLNALTMNLDEKYDVIFSNKVLHHLSKEHLAISLQKQYETLNEGGMIFHAMWRGKGKEWKKKSMPFIKYQPEDIEQMKGKFKIKEIIDYTEMKENDSFIIIMVK